MVAPDHPAAIASETFSPPKSVASSRTTAVPAGETSSVRRVSVVAGFLILVTLLFFWRISFLGRILVEYDLFTYFYPMKAFERTFPLGEGLPLWNPTLFFGTPFFANIQTALLYPLNLVLRFLSPPQAVNVSILLHVFLAGFFMFLFGHFAVRLSVLGALVGALTFMFGGFLSAQAVHINQLNASSWLPLILLCYHFAYRRRSLGWAAFGAITVAVQIFAGHTQEFYLSMVVLAAYAVFLPFVAVGKFLFSGTQVSGGGLPTVKKTWLSGRSIGFVTKEFATALLFAALLVGLGAGLASVQLLPTYELSRLSIRAGGMSAHEASSFSLPPWEIPRAILPGFFDNPFTEFVGYVGFVPLTLGILAIFRSRKNEYTWLGIGLVLLSLVLAIGGYNPFYQKILRFVPGLQLFRVPARWLFVFSFGAGLMAGIGMPAHLMSAAADLRRRASVWRVGLPGLLVAIGLLALTALLQSSFAQLRPELLQVWAALGLFSVLLAVGIVHFAPNRILSLTIVALVLIELFVARQNLTISRAVPAEAYSSMRPSVAQVLADPGLYRILSIADPAYEPGDLPELRRILGVQLPRQQADDYAISTKYKEILTPNLPLRYGIASIDGYDGGVLPLRRYFEFKRVIVDSASRAAPHRAGKKVEPDGILREELPGVPDAGLLAALNVKYVFADKIHDPWVDNIYYDLTFTRALSPSESLTLDRLPSLASSEFGLISYVEGAPDLPDGAPVAQVTVLDAQGQTISAILRTGIDTAEGDLQAGAPKPRHQAARVASNWKGNPEGKNYHTTIDLRGVRVPRQVEVRSLLSQGQFVLRGASLIDARTAASESLTIDPAFRLALNGDVKLYENLQVKPRAFVTTDVRWAADDSAVLALLNAKNRPDLILSPEPGEKEAAPVELPGRSATEASELGGPAPSGSGQNGVVEIIAYAPTRVEMQVTADQPAFVVLSDTYFPGWRAYIDGQEVPILRANYMFRAVQLNEGKHSVLFRFDPPTLHAGLHLTELAVAGVLLLFSFELRRWQKRRAIDGETASHGGK